MANSRGRPSGTYRSNLDTSTLGGFLGNARAIRGLGLLDVAAEIGVTVQFISNIEHGRAPLPAKYVGRISKLLRVDASTLARLAIAKTKVGGDLAAFV